MKKSCNTSAHERSILQSWVLGRFATSEAGVEVYFRQNTIKKLRFLEIIIQTSSLTTATDQWQSVAVTHMTHVTVT